MAITVPATGGVQTGGSSSSSQVDLSTSALSWSAGDIGLVMAITQAATGAWSQTSGTTWTGLGTAGALQNDANSNVDRAFNSFLAWHEFAAGNTNPVFAYPTTSRLCWSAILFRPDSGSTISLDIAAGPTFFTTVQTTGPFTAPAATAAGASEASWAIQGFVAYANSTSAITAGVPSGWTAQSTGSVNGSASTKSNGMSSGTSIPVGSGSVAPGSITTSVNAAGCTSYQVLVKETSAATFTAALPLVVAQAVKTAANW